MSVSCYKKFCIHAIHNAMILHDAYVCAHNHFLVELLHLTCWDVCDFDSHARMINRLAYAIASVNPSCFFAFFFARARFFYHWSFTFESTNGELSYTGMSLSAYTEVSDKLVQILKQFFSFGIKIIVTAVALCMKYD